MDAMRAHQALPELLELSCTALYNLSLDRANILYVFSKYLLCLAKGADILDASEALELFVSTLKNHVDNANVVSEAVSSLGRIFLDDGVLQIST